MKKKCTKRILPYDEDFLKDMASEKELSKRRMRKNEK